MPLRHSIVAFVLFATIAASAQPAWVQLDDSPYNDYRSEDIWFVDADRGWAVDGDGRVHRTVDSGATWTRTATLAGYLRSVAFVTPEIGFVGTIGSENVLYETRDGGLTFTDISDRVVPATHGICSLTAVDDRVVYGGGTYNGPPILIKTVDGGATWTSQSLAPLLDTLIDVHFFDADYGLAVGGIGPFGETTRPRVIGTTDGGATWTVRHTVDVSPGWGWKLSFPTPEIGYVAVEKYDESIHSIVLKTVDGGATWTELEMRDAGGNMQGIGFATAELGWVSGRGVTSRTTDGGATWSRVPTSGELDPNVNRFVFLPGGVGFASGHKIHRLDLGALSPEPEPEPEFDLSVGPNPASRAVRIRYRPTAPEPATVDVFDAVGRRVAALPDPEGDGVLIWRFPEGLPAGTYTVRLQTPAGEETAPLTIVR